MRISIRRSHRPGLADAYLNRAAVQGDCETGSGAERSRSRHLDQKDFSKRSAIAAAAARSRRPQGALVDLNRAIEINNHVAETFYQRGYVYLGLKEFDTALVDFDRAVKLAPDMAWAYQGRGTAWMYKGYMELAIDSFNQAIANDPTIAWAYFNRAVSKVYLGQEPQADVDQCLKLRPDLKGQLDQRLELAKQLRRIARQD
jgi:tetratricopeptide (TPR) repeat protein